MIAFFVNSSVDIKVNNPKISDEVCYVVVILITKKLVESGESTEFLGVFF